jgi:hypothetical protein
MCSRTRVMSVSMEAGMARVRKATSQSRRARGRVFEQSLSQPQGGTIVAG